MVSSSPQHLWLQSQIKDWSNAGSIRVSKSRGAGDFPNKAPLIQERGATLVSKCWRWAGTGMWSCFWNFSLIVHNDGIVFGHQERKSNTDKWPSIYKAWATTFLHSKHIICAAATDTRKSNNSVVNTGKIETRYIHNEMQIKTCI